MQFTKPMIDLVYEIRRRVRSDLKPEVKLANPELLPILTNVYLQDKPDAVTGALIKELMSLAGDDWLARLQGGAATVSNRMISKSYRGQVSHEPAPSSGMAPEAVVTRKPVKIYRGRVVTD